MITESLHYELKCSIIESSFTYHAEGLRFEPGWKLPFLNQDISFISFLNEKNAISLITDGCFNFPLILVKITEDLRFKLRRNLSFLNIKISSIHYLV